MAYVAGLLTVPFLEGFNDTQTNWECVEDNEHGSALLAPMRAWRRRSRALAEMKDNVWVNVFTPEVSKRAAELTYAPYIGLLSLATVGVTTYISGSGDWPVAVSRAGLQMLGVRTEKTPIIDSADRRPTQLRLARPSDETSSSSILLQT